MTQKIVSVRVYWRGRWPSFEIGTGRAAQHAREQTEPLEFEGGTLLAERQLVVRIA
jgi:hypothetical protein